MTCMSCKFEILYEEINVMYSSFQIFTRLYFYAPAPRHTVKKLGVPIDHGVYFCAGMQKVMGTSPGSSSKFCAQNAPWVTPKINNLFE